MSRTDIDGKPMTDADLTIMGLIDKWIEAGKDPAELIDAMARMCVAVAKSNFTESSVSHD